MLNSVKNAQATNSALPRGFESLQVIASDWALPTQTERERRRLASSASELKEVYDLIFPEISRIMSEVDQFPLGELPEAQGRLFSLALTLAEIAPNVELYQGDIHVTNDFDERRFSARHGSHPNWKGLYTR